MSGSRPDFPFLREIRLSVDPSLESSTAIAELIDPNMHSCGTVRPRGEKKLRHDDEGFYIVGSKNYGLINIVHPGFTLRSTLVSIQPALR